jgi:hypothetical protein
MRCVLGFLAALVLAAAAAAAPVRPEGGGPTADDVAGHLADRYPAVTPHVAGQLQFESGTRVVPVDAPALRRADPGLRLFRTTLNTGHHEYWEVGVVVAAWADGGRVATAECPAADYGEPHAAFVARLRGVRGRTADDRAALAAEVCGALAAVTPGGRVEGGVSAGGEYRAELWRGDRLWRRVRVRFDGGAVAGLELVNPAAEK